jgi:hypothetical protein
MNLVMMKELNVILSKESYKAQSWRKESSYGQLTLVYSVFIAGLFNGKKW